MNDDRDPVERTTQLATTVDDLTEAWGFVMARIDELGPDPSIEIKPFWSYHIADFADMDDSGNGSVPRQFSVLISGMVKESSAPERIG